MNKTYIYIIMCIVALAVTACQSDDNLPVQQPDGLKEIQFSVNTQQVVSRAVNYISYDAAVQPTTMGVWGYANAPVSGTSVPDDQTIFNNQQVTYSNNAWSYDTPKLWNSYASPYDFFACMPYTDGATLTKNDNDYTLSFPVSLGENTYVTTSETALICNTPYATPIGNVIPFQMDQTLTGFSIAFGLGEKMDNIRDIIIKGVKLTGDKSMFATRGTVSRTYHRSGSGNSVSWTADDIQWELTTPAADPEVTIPNTKDGADKDTIVLNDHNTNNFHLWGSPFYIIPVANFTPTIQVTYDVTLNGTTNEDGTYTAGETTRTVTSSITLNDSNFKSYKPSIAGTPGTIYPIQIRIVPSYLYVLADADQATGYIVIE